MATWYLAPALKALFAEVNKLFPARDHASDGSIGDADHSARTSDHNPDAKGCVHAIDIDEDLDGVRTNGYWDIGQVVDVLIRNRDSRIKYLIYEGRIMSGPAGPSPWVWRPYSGVNAHAQHLHVSLVYSAAAENDTSPWLVGKQGGTIPPPTSTPAPVRSDDMYFLVRPSDSGAQFLTNLDFKLGMRSEAERDWFLWTIRASGGIVSTLDGGAPHVWSPEDVAMLRDVRSDDESVAARLHAVELRLIDVQNRVGAPIGIDAAEIARQVVANLPRADAQAFVAELARELAD